MTMKQKRVTNGWFYWILFILMVWFFASCSKAQAVTPASKLDKYSMVVDWYTLDTTKLVKRSEWVYDSIYSETIKRQFESATDLWYIDCNMLDRLQHLYYTKNGRKIQPSDYPKTNK